MKALSRVSDRELIERMPKLVAAERARTADVVEHLIEIDRRRLYLDQACASLTSFCIERLQYSDEEASKRVRVARLAESFPRVLEELRSGSIHLTGLFLLSRYVTPSNCDELLAQARGKSRREIEALLAACFPKPDVPERLCAVPEQLCTPASTAGPETTGGASCPGTSGGASCPGTGAPRTDRLEPLSALRWSVQFTAGSELRDKLQRARELLSHAVPSGDLATLFERALDALIEQETKRRLGAGKPRKRRPLEPGSRHVPLDVVRRVFERDQYQCTFVDAEGRRCGARQFLTLEHRQPFALGGPPTLENLCLLCKSHNLHSARAVFGHAHIEQRRARRQQETHDAAEAGGARAKVRAALQKLGFKELEVRRVLADLDSTAVAIDPEVLLRAALGRLAPAAPSRASVDTSHSMASR